jgi:tRNA 2-thiouridine synthesizing protein A
MSDPVELDARRLLCPLPVIRLQDCVNQQAPGIRVRVTCTDPGTQNDIPAWCRINGHALISMEEIDEEFVFMVERDGSGQA